MAAGKLNITIEQGATFSKSLQLKDSEGQAIDLTDSGSAFTSKLRRRPTDSLAAATFTLIVEDSLNGIVSWSLTPIQTAALKAEPHYYDIEMTTGSVVRRLMEGTAFVNFEVTK